MASWSVNHPTWAATADSANRHTANVTFVRCKACLTCLLSDFCRNESGIIKGYP
jgi:hypothetical protein